jgi:tRNA dimethylallyltransferase
VRANSLQKPIVVLVGPTAVGKTELSLAIAERYNGEIVSVDSMQVYSYMDIGTAKPSLEERRGVVHHLLDVVTPDQPYDAACFARDAGNSIEDILRRNRLPILVGGTGLYLKALLQGLFPAPTVDAAVRRQLQQRLVDEGLSSLYLELHRIDTIAAQRIGANDRQRILRALEIYLSSGVTWTEHLQRQADHLSSTRYTKTLQVGLSCDRRQLYSRIDERCRVMVAKGLEEEVISLLSRGYHRNLKPMGAIGYRHMLDYLEGHDDKAVMLEKMSRDTRRYAKRQFTWFSRNDAIQWLLPTETSKIFSIIDQWLS